MPIRYQHVETVATTPDRAFAAIDDLTPDAQVAPPVRQSVEVRPIPRSSVGRGSVGGSRGVGWGQEAEPRAAADGGACRAGCIGFLCDEPLRTILTGCGHAMTSWWERVRDQGVFVSQGVTGDVEISARLTSLAPNVGGPAYPWDNRPPTASGLRIRESLAQACGRYLLVQVEASGDLTCRWRDKTGDQDDNQRQALRLLVIHSLPFGDSIELKIDLGEVGPILAQLGDAS